MCSKAIIWSTVETGLGMNATAACVLRLLFTRFHMLSGSGIHQANPTINAAQGTRRSQDRGLVIKEGVHDNDIELCGVATTVEFSQGCYQGGKRDGDRKTLSFTQANREANETEEGFIRKGNQILVIQAIEV
jgi:hypothetical protein